MMRCWPHLVHELNVNDRASGEYVRFDDRSEKQFFAMMMKD